MLASTITLTVNAVAKILNFTSSSGNSSTYFMYDTAANRDYTISIKHTLPKMRGQGKESHLVRVDWVDYDPADGSVLRKSAHWQVFETSEGIQNDTDMTYIKASLNAFLDTTTLAKVLQRVS